jgi:predicted metal-binding protein
MALFGFGKSKDQGSLDNIQESEPPVSETMIWICEKCAFKLAGNESDNLARGIQKAIKGLISDRKRKSEVRAMVTSCMNVCPTRKIAAGIADLKNGGVRFIECPYEGRIDETAEKLYRLL